MPLYPRSHHFIKPFIRAILGEFLDQMVFWNAIELQSKLEAFQVYNKHNRFHASLESDTPAQVGNGPKPDKPTWNITVAKRIAANSSSSRWLLNYDFEIHRCTIYRV